MMECKDIEREVICECGIKTDLPFSLSMLRSCLVQPVRCEGRLEGQSVNQSVRCGVLCQSVSQESSNQFSQILWRVENNGLVSQLYNLFNSHPPHYTISQSGIQKYFSTTIQSVTQQIIQSISINLLIRAVNQSVNLFIIQSQPNISFFSW